MLRELEVALEPALASMVKSPWRDADFVTAESAYVGDMVAAIKGTVELVRTHVEQKKYTRSFCDKAVGFVLFAARRSLSR